MTHQLDMFLPEAITELQAKFDKCERTATQVRKGLFARNTALSKDMIELRDMIDVQQREIDMLRRKVYDGRLELVELKAM